MPELPEVETIKRTLETKIVGKKITKVQVFLPKVILPLEMEEFQERVEGSFILGLRRRGKYLLVHLSSAFTLVISLRMTGRLVFVPSGQELSVDKHTRLVLEFDEGSCLFFSDIRKFGTIHCIPSEYTEKCPEIAKLGPEPFGSACSEAWFRERLGATSRKIKQLLTDQTFIAGIGNIYADEILFRAGIHPETAADTLSPERIHRLYVSITEILREAITQKGTSVKDYVDGEGNKGNYQAFLKVYGRKGKKCYHCGQDIETIKLGGRTSHFCPHCQQKGN